MVGTVSAVGLVLSMADSYDRGLGQAMPSLEHLDSLLRFSALTSTTGRCRVRFRAANVTNLPVRCEGSTGENA